ncbi:Uncharacterized protein dnm_024580 [Desulfonema magnum]|uniref:Uncharacterized protein n=1 Tax=Desulfonema magnum TaxID=45655 RepID=A0A975BIQ0_9BACT|nr:Uncharacterized protein dnm_024580 [Desulfonema magnum]
MTARAADTAETTGKGRCFFPFLILFPCTFGSITKQQNPSESATAKTAINNKFSILKLFF